MEEEFKAIDQVTTTAIDLAMKFGPKVVVAIIILVIGYTAGGWAGRAVLRVIDRFKLEPPVRTLLERMVRLVVLGLFAIMALQNLGVELLPLIAGLGVAGAGVALAMQGVLGNIVAGLTIIFTRPFRVGDYISIVKEEGLVMEITLFSTVLGHTDRSRVVIPNRKIVGEILHNYGEIRQLGLTVGIAYGSYTAAAIDAIRGAIMANPRVLREPLPEVGVARLAESAILIGAGPWVKVPDYGPAVGELNTAILEALAARGIVIPPPRRDVTLRQVA
jgi:small conductance mechanosensitive channel